MRRRACAVLLAVLPALSGCLLLRGRHWEEARRDVIEPINSALHRHLPRDLKARDLDAVLAFYATPVGGGIGWDGAAPVAEDFAETRLRWSGPEREEPIRDRYERMLALFATIEKAELRIHRIDWEIPDERGYPAKVRLLVRGAGPDGERRMLDQWADIHVDRRGGQWSITDERIVSRELIASGAPAYESVGEAAGVGVAHDTTGSPPFHLLGDIAASSGTAVADFDCDGLEDLALLDVPRVRLYRQQGDGTFAEVSGAFGVGAGFDLAAAGLVFFDADNDGDSDLWVSGIRGDRFYLNQDCRSFADATREAGIEQQTWSSMPLVADYDRDGLLDVYVVRMGDHERSAPTPNWDASNGRPHSLYRNLGGGRFADVTAAAGIDERAWGLAGAWGDYDGDGDPDLYVGNEFGTNSLYRNRGDGTFDEVAEEAGALDRGAAMGVAWGDYDNDGDLDLFVSNMYANSRWALFHPEFPPPVPWYLSWAPIARVHRVTDELSRGSTLLSNDGDGSFTDSSDAAGIRDAQWGWGVAFLDYNNDGWLDVYAANGFITGQLPDDV